MELQIPQSLNLEHEELHRELTRIIDLGGEVGTAARAVARVLHPHFMSEEELAMPPLGLMKRLGRGEVTSDMAEVIKTTDRLKSQLPKLLREHEEIVAALHHLSEVAQKENKPDCRLFAEKLALHAKTEEEVLYPASVLIGEYLKLRLKK